MFITDLMSHLHIKISTFRATRDKSTRVTEIYSSTYRDVKNICLVLILLVGLDGGSLGGCCLEWANLVSLFFELTAREFYTLSVLFARCFRRLLFLMIILIFTLHLAGPSCSRSRFSRLTLLWVYCYEFYVVIDNFGFRFKAIFDPSFSLCSIQM